MNLPHPMHSVRETPKGRVELHPELDPSRHLAKFIRTHYEGINGDVVLSWFGMNVHGPERNELITRMHRSDRTAFDEVIQRWKDAEYIRPIRKR